MHLEYLGINFYCSEFSNNLQILDISNNKLHILYSKTFICLSKLKMLLIYGNKFHRFVKEDIIKNLPLNIYFVEDSIECCMTYGTLCLFINKLTTPCKIRNIFSTTLILVLLLILFLGFISNGAVLVIILLTNLYKKKPLQFLLSVKDVITMLSCASESIFALMSFYDSSLFKIVCFAVGIITSATLLLDLSAKVVNSIFLLKLLEAKSVKSGPKHNIIFRFHSFLFIFSFIGTFIISRVPSIKERVSLSIKLKETLLHCILFCFPKHPGIIVLLSIILSSVTLWVVINLKFIHLIKAHILDMKVLYLKISHVKREQMIKHVTFELLTTSGIVTLLCLLLLALMFSNSFFISYCIIIILCLISMNNLLIFLFSSKSFFFKRSN